MQKNSACGGSRACKLNGHWPRNKSEIFWLRSQIGKQIAIFQMAAVSVSGMSVCSMNLVTPVQNQPVHQYFTANAVICVNFWG